MKLVDLVDAAGAVLADIESGKLTDPDDYEQRAVERARSMFGTVAGPGDPLWPLHLDVARQVLEAGGLSADELAEWATVLRRREQRVSTPDADPEV